MAFLLRKLLPIFPNEPAPRQHHQRVEKTSLSMAIALLSAVAAGFAGSVFTMTLAVAGDVSTRGASAIKGDNRPHCGTRTIDLNAPVISRADMLIKAPLKKVWAAHTDLAGWPSWNKHISYVKRLDDGPLRVGSRFEWVNGGLKIVSVVGELNPYSCSLWGGPGGGIEGIHLWTFTKVGSNTLVHTEESWSGPPVTQNVQKAQTMLDTGLSEGVKDLKKFVEHRTP